MRDRDHRSVAPSSSDCCYIRLLHQAYKQHHVEHIEQEAVGRFLLWRASDRIASERKEEWSSSPEASLGKSDRCQSLCPGSLLPPWGGTNRKRRGVSEPKKEERKARREKRREEKRNEKRAENETRKEKRREKENREESKKREEAKSTKRREEKEKNRRGRRGRR